MQFDIKLEKDTYYTGWTYNGHIEEDFARYTQIDGEKFIHILVYFDKNEFKIDSVNLIDNHVVLFFQEYSTGAMYFIAGPHNQVNYQLVQDCIKRNSV